ncbi:MAG: hypothetical protein HEP71_32385 [Roseivirga sp.]|nr:hypothetical protein [Roseivirga sp.]
MKTWIGLLAITCLLLCSGCNAVQLSSGKVLTDGTIDMTNPSSMDKDAVRVVGKIEKVNDADDKRGSFNLTLEKIVKYGATFSSMEPKVGTTVILSTPVDVSFNEGDVILIDIITPRIDKGEKPVRVRMG